MDPLSLLELGNGTIQSRLEYASSSICRDDLALVEEAVEEAAEKAREDRWRVSSSCVGEPWTAYMQAHGLVKRMSDAPSVHLVVSGR